MDDEVQIIKACDIEKNLMGASHKIINPFYHAAWTKASHTHCTYQ